MKKNKICNKIKRAEHYTVNTFSCPILSFCNTILLRCERYSCLMIDTLSLQVFLKFFGSVFPTIVRS